MEKKTAQPQMAINLVVPSRRDLFAAVVLGALVHQGVHVDTAVKKADYAARKMCEALDCDTTDGH
jgi:hypothetical protein